MRPYIIAYLGQHHHSRMVFDPTYPDVDYDAFPDNDWTKFHGKIEEATRLMRRHRVAAKYRFGCTLTVIMPVISSLDAPKRK